MSSWKSNPRQQYFDLMTRARAEAFAGRTEEALRNARDALAGLERSDNEPINFSVARSHPRGRHRICHRLIGPMV